tara:strand:+ start:85 stop:615 length:531 start_codon:yes stop_codon:yes gene_type:complete
MAERKIAGTNEIYTGMVIKLGDFEYTTVGGGIEGDRQQLAPMDTSETSPPTTNNNNTLISEEVNIVEDVVTTFVVGDGSLFGNGSYFYNDGTPVPAGTELHHHTIIPQGNASNFMTQHVMDENAIDVFTTINNQNTNQQNNQITGGPSNQNQTTSTQTMGGMSGGGTSGGGGGGGY